MSFDESGNYVLSGDPNDQMSMAGTGAQGYMKKSKFRSFLDAFSQPQQSPYGRMQGPSLIGGLARMGQGSGGALGAIGKFASFLA